MRLNLGKDGRRDAMYEIGKVHSGETAILRQRLSKVRIRRYRAPRQTLISLRMNVKLGGKNTALDARSASILSDPANPTIVLGRNFLVVFTMVIYSSRHRCRRHTPGPGRRRTALVHLTRRQCRQ